MATDFAKTLRDPSLLQQGSFINGEWIRPSSRNTFSVFNPASGAVIGTCPESTLDDLNAATVAAEHAFASWASLPGRSRANILRRFFELLVANKEDIGKIILAENGKAKADAEGEVLFSAGFFEWFAEEAPRIYGDVVSHSNPTSRTHVLKQPIGVCGLITPWNFPMAMGARKVAAALAAGCTVVLKPDGLTPFSSNVLAVLGQRAGVPSGVINIVTAKDDTPKIGLAMCESATIKKISFTGSTRVGKLLMQQSSGTLKKLSLELGGNAPFIVFDDCDIDVAIASALISKFKVTGQTCVCANRIFVQEQIYGRFVERFVAEVAKFRVGHGDVAATSHGPLTNGIQKVVEHVRDAVGKNGTILHGGRALPELGPNFHELTIIGDATDEMLVAQEETFGPLAALFKFKTEEEVIRRANASEFGLASYVMTQNINRAHRVSERLEFGMVALNTGVISDPGSP